MKTEWREGIGVEVLNLLGFIALFDNRAPNNRALENDHCVFDLIPIRILDTARIPAQYCYNPPRVNGKPSLLLDLPHDRLRRRFSGLNGTRGKTPKVVMLLLAENPAALVPNNCRHCWHEQ